MTGLRSIALRALHKLTAIPNGTVIAARKPAMLAAHVFMGARPVNVEGGEGRPGACIHSANPRHAMRHAGGGGTSVLDAPGDCWPHLIIASNHSFFPFRVAVDNSHPQRKSNADHRSRP